MIAATPEAYELMLRGAAALAQVESTGMRVDMAYLRHTIDKTARRMAKLEKRLKEQPEYKAQRKRFGHDTKLKSRDQLAHVLFDVQGHEVKAYTSGGESGEGRAKLDEGILRGIGTKYCRNFLKWEKLNKLHGTYLTGLLRETIDGRVHPNFNLHTVVTYRSSSSNPNFQNIPIRDPEIAEIIRRAFIPDEDHVILDIDYGAQEVRVAACYHHDPTMIDYIRTGYDLHADMARECYLLDEATYTKALRREAKGRFVFAEFYGSHHSDVANGLFSVATSGQFDTADGQPLLDHLAAKGVGKAGKFGSHIEEVDRRFWKERFPVYDKWRREWVAEYKRKGYFKMHTGFVCQGTYKRNEVINYPVQGAAFHCLLWSLIKIVNHIRRNKLRSRVVGQIHDSLVLTVHKDEIADLLPAINQIMTGDILKAWPWLIVPLAIEIERGDANWHEKREVGLDGLDV